MNDTIAGAIIGVAGGILGSLLTVGWSEFSDRKRKRATLQDKLQQLYSRQDGVKIRIVTLAADTMVDALAYNFLKRQRDYELMTDPQMELHEEKCEGFRKSFENRKNIYDTLLQEYFTIVTEFEFYLNNADFVNEKISVLTFPLNRFNEIQELEAEEFQKFDFMSEKQVIYDKYQSELIQLFSDISKRMTKRIQEVKNG